MPVSNRLFQGFIRSCGKLLFRRIFTHIFSGGESVAAAEGTGEVGGVGESATECDLFDTVGAVKEIQGSQKPLFKNVGIHRHSQCLPETETEIGTTHTVVCRHLFDIPWPLRIIVDLKCDDPDDMIFGWLFLRWRCLQAELGNDFLYLGGNKRMTFIRCSQKIVERTQKKRMYFVAVTEFQIRFLRESLRQRPVDPLRTVAEHIDPEVFKLLDTLGMIVAEKIPRLHPEYSRSFQLIIFTVVPESQGAVRQKFHRKNLAGVKRVPWFLRYRDTPDPYNGNI